ncbi:hypothetical protein D3C79_544080 [compost metagenome]
MAIARSLGQAGGTGGENQQRGRLGLDLAAHVAREGRSRRAVQARGKMAINPFGQCTVPGIFSIRQQPVGQRRQVISGVQAGQALLADHHRLGGGGGQGMQQRPPADLGVDERHHHTEFDQTEPGVEKGRAVLHQQCTHIPGAQALGIKGVRHLVGAGVDLGVAERLAGINQKRPLAVFAHLLFKAVGQGVAVTRLDLCAGGGTPIEQRLGVLARQRRTDRQIALRRGHGVTSRLSA